MQKKSRKFCCHICDNFFGQESKLLDHFTIIHDRSDHQALYDEVKLNGVRPKCQCGKCDLEIKWFGWKKGYISRFARGHNATVDSVYLDKDRQTEFAKKRTEGYRSGKYKVWNDGLTKETDERVSLMTEKIKETLVQGYRENRYKIWQKDQTLETNESLKKSSQTHRESYRTGRIVQWAKGKTKSEDNRIAKLGRSISHTMKTNVSSARRHSPSEFKEIFEQHAKSQFTLITDPESYRNKYQQLQIQCKTCNSTFEKTLMQFRGRAVCNTCHPNGSKLQLEIFDFVKSLGFNDAISCDRTIISPREIDIYVPSMKFGIEFNGLYWHSEAVAKDRETHQKKHELAKNAGIRLLSIFEDEWLHKRHIVESMIRARLNIYERTFDARKLEIKEIDSRLAKNLFINSHLEGHVQASKYVGLLQNENLVAALSLRVPRNRNRSNETRFEVARAVCKRDVRVRGWLGRLSKKAREIALREGYSGLMTYVDGRVGDGNGYVKAGWKYERQTPIRYWWTDHEKRYDRQTFKNDTASELSETQIAAAEGMYRINGCKNAVFGFS